jgi:predicted Zn finger-like uncharacterized protein
MPIESNCPGCGAKVRVPESLLGKSVKCPKCQSVFTAENPEPGFEEVAEDEPRPRRRRPAPDEEYDDRGDDYDDRPRRRRGGRRSNASSAVAAPAIGLLISGIIGLLLALLGIAVGIIALATGAGKQMGAPGGGDPTAFLVGRVAGSVLNLALSGIMVSGSMKMKRLESRGAAKTACILGMLPCAGCCLIGLPFGIWGLVALNNPDVDRAFDG